MEWLILFLAALQAAALAAVAWTAYDLARRAGAMKASVDELTETLRAESSAALAEARALKAKTLEGVGEVKAIGRAFSRDGQPAPSAAPDWPEVALRLVGIFLEMLQDKAEKRTRETPAASAVEGSGAEVG